MSEVVQIDQFRRSKTTVLGIKFVDRPPTGWHALDVMRATSRKWDWVGFMIDVHPDDLNRCRSKAAWLYVEPDDYRPAGNRTAQEVYVRIPGKYRNKEAAWSALHDIITALGH